MKSLKIIFFTVIFSQLIIKAQTPSCHSVKEFAMLADDEKFRAEHATPQPFTYTGEGNMINFKTADGKSASAFLIESKKSTNNYLFVFHEWWGLNDHIKKQASEFYKDLGNVNVLALDLYDGKITADRDEAGKLMQSLDNKRAEAIIKGALQYVGEKARIFTVGWCMGGGWSLQAALLAEGQCGGSIIYYGMPEQNVDRLKNLKCDVLGIFAANDEWITQDVVKKFDENMKAAKKQVDIVSFDADHAFANPSNPQFDKEATAKAYNYSIEFLKARMK